MTGRTTSKSMIKASCILMWANFLEPTRSANAFKVEQQLGGSVKLMANSCVRGFLCLAVIKGSLRKALAQSIDVHLSFKILATLELLNSSIIDPMLCELQKIRNTIIAIILIGQHCFIPPLHWASDISETRRRRRKSESRFVHFIGGSHVSPLCDLSRRRRSSLYVELCAARHEIAFSFWQVQWRHSVLRAHLNIIHGAARKQTKNRKRSFRNYEITFSAQLNLAAAHSPLVDWEQSHDIL